MIYVGRSTAVPDNTCVLCSNTTHEKRRQNDSLTSPSVRSDSSVFWARSRSKNKQKHITKNYVELEKPEKPKT